VSASSGGIAVKELRCRHIGFDCDAVAHGESVDDVMARVGPHAKEAHGVDVTPGTAARTRRSSTMRDGGARRRPDVGVAA
jgi:predicted small metal-binding protein